MRRRVVVALAAGLIFYALSDILLWQRIFEAHRLYQYDTQYQSGHLTVLVGMISVGMVLLYESGIWAIWYALAFYTLAFSGLADVLYYVLDGREIPNRAPWLDENRLILFKPVTGTSLMLSAAVWTTIWGASLLLLPMVTNHVDAVRIVRRLMLRPFCFLRRLRLRWDPSRDKGNGDLDE